MRITTRITLIVALMYSLILVVIATGFAPNYQFPFAAGFGLASLVLLGAMLRYALAKNTGDLAEFIAHLSKGGEVALPLPKEFSQIGRALQRLGEEASQLRSSLNAMSQLLQVGLIRIGSQKEVLFINSETEALLHSQDQALQGRPEIERRAAAQSWEAAPEPAYCGQLEGDKSLWQVLELIAGEIDKLQRGEHSQARVDLELNRNHPAKKLRLELYNLDPEQWRGCLVLIRDRGNLEALHADLRAATRFRSLSNLYLGAAHDLRAPIQSMLLNLELLKQKIVRESEAVSDQRQHVEILHDDLMRLQYSLTAFLDQAEPTEELQCSRIELGELANRVVRVLAAQARHKGIHLHQEIPPRPVYVFVSSDQLKQALINILMNAFEALPSGGEVKLSLEADERVAAIRVSDSGPGIPAALSGRIFDMHFSTKPSGTGIGLYVVRSIIEQYQGRVSIEQDRTQGACIRIELPLCRHRRARSQELESESVAQPL